jgi:hypothetical protein
VRSLVSSSDVRTNYELGWAELVNGELMRAAERDGFEVVVTCDQNIKHQNNLDESRLALVMLDTTHWPTILDSPNLLHEAVEQAVPGSYVAVVYPRRTVRRRSPPRGDLT